MYVWVCLGRYAFHKEPAGGTDVEGEKKNRLLKLFGHWNYNVVDLIKATPEEDVLRRDIYDRPPMFSWAKGNVALLGDSAHAMQPNLGQGEHLGLIGLKNRLWQCHGMQAIKAGHVVVWWDHMTLCTGEAAYDNPNSGCTWHQHCSRSVTYHLASWGLAVHT